MKTLLLKSPLMIFSRPLTIFLSQKTSKFVCDWALVIQRDVFRSAVDFADSISLIHVSASIGRLAHEDTSLLDIRPTSELKLFSFPFLGSGISH